MDGWPTHVEEGGTHSKATVWLPRFLQTAAATECPPGYTERLANDSVTSIPPIAGGPPPPLVAGPCSPCSPGTFSNTSRSACEPCPADTYAPGYASVECLPCPPHSATLDEVGSRMVSSCRCLAGFRKEGQEGGCKPCKGDVYCPGPANASTTPLCKTDPVLSGGGWYSVVDPLSVNDTVHPIAYERCPIHETCMQCSQCMPEHQGVLCFNCEAGLTRRYSSDGLCQSCPGTADRVAGAVGFALVVILYVGGVTYLVTIIHIEPTPKKLEFHIWLIQLRIIFHVLTLAACIAYDPPFATEENVAMVSSSIRYAHSNIPFGQEWPMAWDCLANAPLTEREITEGICRLQTGSNETQAIDERPGQEAVDQTSTPSAYGIHLRVLVIAPFAGLGVIVVGWLAYYVGVRVYRQYHGAISIKELARNVTCSFVLSSLVWLYLCYSPATRYYSLAWQCREFADGRHRLVADPDIFCGEDRHLHLIASFATPGVLAYTVAFPTVVSVSMGLVGRARHRPRYRRALGYLMMGYQPRFYMWEAWAIFRGGKLVVMVLACALVFGVQSVCRPFDDTLWTNRWATLNQLENAGLFAVLVASWGFLAAHYATPENQSGCVGAAVAVLVAYLAVALVFLLLSLKTVVGSVLTWLCGKAEAHGEPELGLEEDMRLLTDEDIAHFHTCVQYAPFPAEAVAQLLCLVSCPTLRTLTPAKAAEHLFQKGHVEAQDECLREAVPRLRDIADDTTLEYESPDDLRGELERCFSDIGEKLGVSVEVAEAQSRAGRRLESMGHMPAGEAKARATRVWNATWGQCFDPHVTYLMGLREASRSRITEQDLSVFATNFPGLSRQEVLGHHQWRTLLVEVAEEKRRQKEEADERDRLAKSWFPARLLRGSQPPPPREPLPPLRKDTLEIDQLSV
ncbi:unnamed protein product [Vitrella brassicaformis CCMP3155]|uniref:Tyrosine-protein kinase ephrin type A/B receptor-like domain-containing protein n=1 Tax=Vitrella brassicaformis (strain CCMP3155) TaxID=1169540 RepID=A0A0G4GY60_VITBC|nr:unnamed protein product [Vitrella brassicaformis CCMP3155]|eukprot:CEM35911.1 unnamed protein product [Vitrella brassicaformis CCMP3155]